MRYAKFVFLLFLTPFMALAGFFGTAVVLGLVGLAVRDNPEYFKPDLTSEPGQLIGSLICLVGAIFCGISPWYTRLNPWKKQERPVHHEPLAMRYVKLALLAILTPFLAYVGFLAAVIIFCIPAIVFTTNYESFAPALSLEPRHLIGSLGCFVGATLGAISPWFTPLNPRVKWGRSPKV